MRAVLVLAIAGSLALSVPARADTNSYRAVVDRAELEPAAFGGYRLRVYLSALALGGQLLDVGDAHALHVFAGGSEIKAPYALGRYQGQPIDTQVVFVVEVSGAYGDVLPTIVDALDHDVLGALPEHAQVAVLTYGAAVGASKLGSIKAARGRLAAAQSDGTNDDPALADAIERALALLKKATPRTAAGTPATTRQLIVVVGDGRDRDTDRERITRLGTRAGTANVRIHALAYAPTDARRPLLALGELAKRSLGTFRWIRGARADSWQPATKQLAEELAQQYVATWYVDDASAAGKKLHVATTGRVEVTSNDVKVGEPGCGGSACDADAGGYCAGTTCVVPSTSGEVGILGWLLWVIGIAVGAVLLLAAIGFAMSRRKPRPFPVGVPGAAPMPVAAAGPANASQPPVSAPPGPVLYFLSGPRASSRVPLRDPFTIGKAPTCDLVIDDGYTSGLHARITRDATGAYHLQDNQSTNGTFVNGVRVTTYALQHGVVIRIGSTDVRFLAD